MGYTITKKILAAKCNHKDVHTGDFITAQVDLVVVSDLDGVMAIEEFEKIKIAKLFNPQKVVFSLDRNCLSTDYDSMELIRSFKDFAGEYNIKYFDVSQSGDPHLFLPELGNVFPGELIVGSDPKMSSFGFLSALGLGVGATDITAAIATGELWLQVPDSIKVVFNGEIPKWVTGKDLVLYLVGIIGVAGALNQVIEFSGDSIDILSLSDRYAICNMIVETGAISGLFPPDQSVQEFYQNHNQKKQEFLFADLNADYSIVYEVDVSELEPLIAAPHSPDNVIPVSNIGDVEIDQVVIGSSSSGTIEDLQAAANILEGHQVHPHVRTVIIPGTQQIYLEALRRGLLEIFLQANCVISPFTNGRCAGDLCSALDKNERCIITGNQNYKGIMGHPESEVYLASSFVAASSAILGKITSPADILR